MDEDDDPPSSEEMMSRVGKQRVPVDVVRRNLIINKVGPKGPTPSASTQIQML